jgi:hypothetical protein
MLLYSDKIRKCQEEKLKYKMKAIRNLSQQPTEDIQKW